MSSEWKGKSVSKWKGEPISRRRFLGYATIGLGAIISALVATPLIGSLLSPLLEKKKEKTGWAELGKTEDFKVGQPKRVQWTTATKEGWVVETTPRAVWVVTLDGKKFIVFNPKCTHLNCAYSWYLEGEPHETAYGSKMPDEDYFFCPCHDGVYDITGKVVSGPPPRPLDTLPVKIENGKLFTIYEDFRAGISEKIEI